jgi:hypothetical protein
MTTYAVARRGSQSGPAGWTMAPREGLAHLNQVGVGRLRSKARPTPLVAGAARPVHRVDVSSR